MRQFQTDRNLDPSGKLTAAALNLKAEVETLRIRQLDER
jgi:hypothetical protein